MGVNCIKSAIYSSSSWDVQSIKGHGDASFLFKKKKEKKKKHVLVCTGNSNSSSNGTAASGESRTHQFCRRRQ